MNTDPKVKDQVAQELETRRGALREVIDMAQRAITRAETEIKQRLFEIERAREMQAFYDGAEAAWKEKPAKPETPAG